MPRMLRLQPCGFFYQNFTKCETYATNLAPLPWA